MTPKNRHPERQKTVEYPSFPIFRDKDGRVLSGKLWTREGPPAGLSLLTWKIVGPKHEAIELPPNTDVVVRFENGDFSKISMINPEDITQTAESSVRAKNKNDLRYVMTNVELQANDPPQGLDVSLGDIESMALRIGEPLTFGDLGGLGPRQSTSPISHVLVYDRRKTVNDKLVPNKTETPLMDEFRARVAARKRAKGLGDSATAGTMPRW